MAVDLNLPHKDPIFNLIESVPLNYDHLCRYLTDDAQCREKNYSDIQRKTTLQTLKSWAETKNTPLEKLLTHTYELLGSLQTNEPDDRIRKRMERLISGTVTFHDTDVND